ncbi:MAG: hypothetical protein N4A68_10380 [Maledivibacter sp.]|jgi:hypothetical protein|nr:hypothetical protein [Maledivibacter sp.]
MTNYNQMNQYEIQEAKKRMGTMSGSNGSGAGMTNTTAGAGMTNTAAANAQLKSSEKIQAQEDMNKNSMY